MTPDAPAQYKSDVLRMAAETKEPKDWLGDFSASSVPEVHNSTNWINLTMLALRVAFCHGPWLESHRGSLRAQPERCNDDPSLSVALDYCPPAVAPQGLGSICWTPQ
ncbi:hypothetical protein BO78DRAFT_422489 [Aspergillus sclerotiicarbonarius CBS 121057]|uniref:Uncharacterized protein n=1 Tax=Aspergillus sclerotiicarbonarius (strain CBS 121057 / IBT 28362) TaxID=1448318 RepID=A0A319DXN3_ASPSB|nr:hypothetical protein BO78DRAFT_422489 [Aspergillus sclerotiicarbonarius CBS 121057]